MENKILLKTVHGQALHSRLTQLSKVKNPRIKVIHELFRLCRTYGATMFVQESTIRLQYRGETRLASTIEEIENLKGLFYA